MEVINLNNGLSISYSPKLSVGSDLPRFEVLSFHECSAVRWEIVGRLQMCGREVRWWTTTTIPVAQLEVKNKISDRIVSCCNPRLGLGERLKFSGPFPVSARCCPFGVRRVVGEHQNSSVRRRSAVWFGNAYGKIYRCLRAGGVRHQSHFACYSKADGVAAIMFLTNVVCW